MNFRPSTNTGPIPDVSVLVKKYGKLVFMVCCKVLKNRETALDASQIIWEIVIRKVHTFRQESDPGTWLYSIAYREALRIARREKTRSYKSLLDMYHCTKNQPRFSGSPDDETQLSVWMTEKCNNCVTGVIRTLGFRSRIIFVFRFIIELSYPEIARILGMRENTVRQAAQRARKRLAGFLTNECGIFRKGSPCRCGLEGYLSAGTFRSEMLSLQTITEKARTLQERGEPFPPLEYWEKIHARCHKRESSTL